MSNISIPQLCKNLGIFPAKSRGQNFLIDQNVIEKTIEAADIQADDIILEVGPGFGALTEKLLARAKQVIAVELDKKLHQYLAEKFPKEISSGKLILVNSDILKVNLNNLGLKDYGYKIAANLPYSITSNFLRNFTENMPRPSEIIVMIQYEVARRIMAKPGDMSILSVAIQYLTNPEILFKISKNSFWPEPEIDSAMIRLVLKQNSGKKSANSEFGKNLMRLVRIGFSAKRKQLHNNLSAGLHLKNGQIKAIFYDLGWQEDIRAQDLSVEDWVKLLNCTNQSKNNK